MMKNCAPIALLIATLLLFLGSGVATAAMPPTVTIAPNVPYVVNGVGLIQDMTGVAVNGASQGEQSEETKALHLPATRIYLWVDSGLPDKLKADETIEAHVKQQFDENYGPYRKGKPPLIPTNPQFAQLIYNTRWNADKHIILHLGQPHPRNEAEFALYARWYRACIREIRQRFPQLHVRWVMFYNEPDFEYPRPAEADGPPQTMDFLFRFYKVAAADIHKEFPDVDLIGPGISGYLSWAAIQYWDIPFLKANPTTPWFNAQPYTHSYQAILAYTETLEAASLNINHKRVRTLFTENNVDLASHGTHWWDDRQHADRVTWEAQCLFHMLAHPDQFTENSFFLYDYTRNASDMWFNVDGKVVPSPTYQLYWLLRNLHGRRIYAGLNDYRALPVQVIAARQGNFVTLCLYNDSDQTQTLALKTLGTATANSVDYLYFDPTLQRFQYGTRILRGLAGGISLHPGEAQAINLTTAGPLSPHLIEEREFFASAIGTEVGLQNATMRLDTPAIKSTEQAYLRIGFTSDDPSMLRRFVWRFNGHPLMLPLEQGLWAEIPIPSKWLAAHNTFTFPALPGATYRVLFASLSYRPRPTGAPALSLPTDPSYRPPAIEAALTLANLLSPGTSLLALEIENHTAQPVTALPQFTLPEGWSLTPPSAFVSLKAGERSTVRYALKVSEGGLRGSRTVTANVKVGGLPDVMVTTQPIYQPALYAAYADIPVKLDGTIKPWTAPPYVTQHTGPDNRTYTTRTYLEWDADCLYIAVQVQGRTFTKTEGDRLQLLLDYLATRRTLRDEYTMQTDILFRDWKAGGIVCDNLPSDPGAKMLETTHPKTYRCQVDETPDGYLAEAALDWKSLSGQPPLPASAPSAPSVVPHAGQCLGFDVALDGANLLESAAALRPDDPSAWGEVTLLPAGQTPETYREQLAANRTLPPVDIDFAALAHQPNPSPLVDLQSGSHIDLQGIAHISRLDLTAPLPGLMAGDGLDTTITLDGLEVEDGNTTDGGLPGKPDARIYWTPGKWNEPYVITDAPVITLYTTYDSDAHNIHFRLDYKDGGTGFGDEYWGGAIDVSKLPVVLHLHLDRDHYQIRADSAIETLEGTLSGSLGLHAYEWNGPVHFGITTFMNGGHGSAHILLRRIQVHIPFKQ